MGHFSSFRTSKSVARDSETGGPKTDAWGAPLDAPISSELLLPKSGVADLFFGKSETKFNTEPPIPKDWFFCTSILWYTESVAWLKFRLHIFTNSFLIGSCRKIIKVPQEVWLTRSSSSKSMLHSTQMYFSRVPSPDSESNCKRYKWGSWVESFLRVSADLFCK